MSLAGASLHAQHPDPEYVFRLTDAHGQPMAVAEVEAVFAWAFGVCHDPVAVTPVELRRGDIMNTVLVHVCRAKVRFFQQVQILPR